MKQRILVVGAHPDDEVLGCGATVALRVSQGWEARLVIMTAGVDGRNTIAQTLNAEYRSAVQILESESKRAADVLGFSKVTRFQFPDNRMDTVSRMDLTHAILGEIKDYRPDVIFVHHPGDYNWDHTITFDALMMAARQSPGEFGPKEILSFEVPSSTERAWQNGERAFHPNYYINVSKTIDKKKLAMSYYASECRPYPHPRSLEALEYLARKRGYEVGIEYAEAFCLIRKVEG